MTSVEKLLAFLEQLDDHDDDQLAAILPLPPRVVRMAIAGASTRIPDDPDQLDEWALRAAQFCLSVRSDNAPSVELIGEGATVES